MDHIGLSVDPADRYRRIRKTLDLGDTGDSAQGEKRGLTEMQPTDAELLEALSCPADLERLAVLAAIAQVRPALAAKLIGLWREFDERPDC